MATMTTVTLVDDLDGSEASESVSFALDGASYEIDLSEDNAEKLRDALAGYVASARRVDGAPPRPGRPEGAAKPAKAARGARTAPDREQTAAIREWARANGYEVSERGRLSATRARGVRGRALTDADARAARRPPALGAPHGRPGPATAWTAAARSPVGLACPPTVGMDAAAGRRRVAGPCSPTA